jgi:hypothetical protein
MARYGQDSSTSFNQLDWLISDIYDQVRAKDMDWADDIIAALSDALYDGRPMQMHLILNEWGANRYLTAQFIRTLEDAIEQYAFETQNYGI